MPEWIHERAKHILAKNPSMPESEAWAVATQQSHALGKSPKSYGTKSGRETAKAKYDTPKDDKKAANPGNLESAKMAAFLKAADGEFKLQGHTKFQELPIAIENRKGSVRSGVAKDGTPWCTVMKLPYGYIKGSKGADGEGVDVYVGPKKDATHAYVVHQHKADGTGYDEDKAMLGFAEKGKAIKAYLQHYDDPKFLGPVSTIPMDKFKELLKTHEGRKLTLKEASFSERLSDGRLVHAKIATDLRYRNAFLEGFESVLSAEYDLASRLGGVATSRQPTVHSTFGHTKVAGHVSDSGPSSSHLHGFLEVPLAGTAVCSSMTPLVGQLKIADVVVQSVPVSMVNDLSSTEVPSEKLGHDDSMFELLPTLVVDQSVLRGPTESPYVPFFLPHVTQRDSSSFRKQAWVAMADELSKIAVSELTMAGVANIAKQMHALPSGTKTMLNEVARAKGMHPTAAFQLASASHGGQGVHNFLAGLPETAHLPSHVRDLGKSQALDQSLSGLKDMKVDLAKGGLVAPGPTVPRPRPGARPPAPVAPVAAPPAAASAPTPLQVPRPRPRVSAPSMLRFQQRSYMLTNDIQKQIAKLAGNTKLAESLESNDKGTVAGDNQVGKTRQETPGALEGYWGEDPPKAPIGTTERDPRHEALNTAAEKINAEDNHDLLDDIFQNMANASETDKKLIQENFANGKPGSYVTRSKTLVEMTRGLLPK